MLAMLQRDDSGSQPGEKQHTPPQLQKAVLQDLDLVGV